MDLYPYMVSLGMPEGLPGLTSEQQADWLRGLLRDMGAKHCRLEAEMRELKRELKNVSYLPKHT